jgi:hypothetical protein
MKFRLKFLFITLCLSIGLACHSQVRYKILSGEKSVYAANDEISIRFQLSVDPNSCQDGMEKTGIYASGMQIQEKSEWLELKKGLWQIVVKCKITGNKKGFGQLTVVRKTDKQDLFEQVKFKLTK